MTCTEDYREHIEYTFHAFCKVVIYAAKHEARFMKLLIEQNEDVGKRRNAASNASEILIKVGGCG